jgi:integrase
VNNDLACIKALYSYFITLETVTENPAKRIKFLPMDNQQMRVFSFDEEKLYLAACPQPLHDVAVLMLDTGMRPDELYRLRRENVNLALGTVFNPYGKSKAARRKLALTSRAAELLRVRLGAGESVYIFPLDGDPSRPIGDLNYMHRRALKDSGIAKARMYDLRHTFASRSVEAGVDLVTLAALMGHSKIQMVLRYAHPSEEHQLLAIRKLEEFTIARQIAETNGAAAGLIN